VTRSRCFALGRVIAAVASLGLGRAQTARASEGETHGEIALEVRACPETFDASLRRILAIELGGLLEERRVGASATESLEIACEAELARIVARGAHEVVHNDVRFDAFPGDAAPRAVALAALEALRAVDPTLAERIVARRSEARSAERATPLPAADARRAPRGAVPSRASMPAPAVASRGFTRVLAGGAARLFFAEPRTFSAGGRVELGARFRSPWDAGVDVDGTFARRRVGLGTVDARALSSAAWFGVRAGGVAWSVTGAVGGRLGLALLTGAPIRTGARGHRIVRPWGGPTLAMRTDGAIGLFALALVVEGGLAVAGAEGLSGGAPVIALASGWAAASANVGIRF
jgi:hypothetical protein